MSLLDRFRPDWKHTDAEVRADAVRQLGASAKQTLAEVARTDPDAKIRSIAVRKIEDVELLREIAGSDGDPKVAELANERADQLLAATASGEDSTAALEALGRISGDSTLVEVVKTAKLEEVRDQALARISSSDDLLEVARQAPETGSRKKAVERLDDTEALTTLALQEQYGEIALAALARLDDPQTLLRASREAEVKTVREEASRRLDLLSDEEHPTRLADRRARQLELIARVEKLAASSDWDSARDGIESARSAWLEMGAAEDDELGRQFFEARERFIQRFKEHLGESTSEPTAAEAAAVEAPAAETPAPEPKAEEPTAAPESAATESAATKPAATEPAATEPAATEPAAEPAAAVEASSEEASAETPPSTAAETPAEAADSKGDGEKAPAPPPKPAKDGGKKDTPERAIARLRSLSDRLDSMTSSEQLNLRKAERALREAHDALSEGGPAHSHEDWPAVKKHLEKARDELVPKVRQIEQEEEWKRWANVPLQEALCERMEALIETDDLAKASRELRTLSEEWKTVATVPREKSEELWQRFRGAREKVREKVKVFLQEQDVKRKENLQKKTLLCEKAEELADSTEWRDTANKLKALQAEWKKIGPVPRKVSDQIWKRFRAACDQFFNARKEHYAYLDKEREQNLEKKTALCQEAESLAESTDWDVTTDKIKRLQARWKEIGPVPRKVSDQIWKRFRAACDRFFDRRSRKDELPLEDNLKKKEAALAELEALLPKPEPPAAAEPAEKKAQAKEKPAEKKPEEEAKAEAKPEEADKPEKAKEPEEAKEADKPEADKPEKAKEPEEAKEAAPEAPAEEPAGEEPADEKTPAEEPPAEEPPQDEPSKDEAPQEETPQEEASQEEVAAEATDAGPPENLAESIQSALASWRQAGEIPSSRRAALDKRYASVSSALMEAYPEGLEGTELDPKALAEKRQSLAERADAVIEELKAELKESKAEPEPSLEDLAQQLKEAFAANTIRKGNQTSAVEDRFRKPRRTLRGLRERWQELPGQPDPKLAKRFNKAFKDLEKLEKEQAS